jgi:hypothetical protein
MSAARHPTTHRSRQQPPANPIDNQPFFIEQAIARGELYGRTMVVFAAQHYAQQLVQAASKRRHSMLPSSHDDRARQGVRACVPVGVARDAQAARARDRPRGP